MASALGTNLSSCSRRAARAGPARSGYAIRCAAPRICFGRVGSRSGGSSRCSPGACTSTRSSLAPLSSVQAVLSGGLVFLAVLAERFFGFHLGRRQWAGVRITAAGLAVIGLTSTAEGPQRSSLAALIAVETRDPGARGRAGQDLDAPRHRAPRRGASARDRRRRAVRGLRRRDQVPHARARARCSACSARGRSPR